MKKFSVTAAVAILLVATSAFAQTAGQTTEPGTITMNQTGYQQTGKLAVGKITEVDLARGTVTLDNGMQFTLAPSFQYTSSPALGQEVQVTYSEKGGQKVARIIDVGGTHSQDSGNQ